MPTIQVPTEPAFFSNAESVDFAIWTNGIRQFNEQPYRQAQHPPPHELDYLRGFHCHPTLNRIRAHLLASEPNALIRVSSVWLDKFCYVRPHQTTFVKPRRELADLAVIVSVNGKSRWMWLLQAKKMSAPTAALPNDASTRKELELLTGNLSFDFERHGAPVMSVPIDIAKQFGTSSFNHWSFLSILDDPANFASTNPLQWMWPAPQPREYGSFTEELSNLCRRAITGTGASKGECASTHPQSEWTKLREEIELAGHTTAYSGHAREASILASLLRINAFLGYSEHLFVPPNYSLFRPAAFDEFDRQLLTTGFACSESGPYQKLFGAHHDVGGDVNCDSPFREWPASYSERSRHSQSEKPHHDPRMDGGGRDGDGDGGGDGGEPGDDGPGGGVPATLLVDLIEPISRNDF